tara:strand:- start:3714 stop:4874 length:1161 start_codon:yes stop_codon:yes gene_type:complete
MPFFAKCIAFLCLANCLEAQNSIVGYQSLELFDANRNRLVSVEIYYPADKDYNISEGDFPVIVFGHGFLMDWMAYENFWTSLVPEGYVLCFPTTEMGLTPSHHDFGEDIKFIAQEMQSMNTITSSLYFGALSEKTVLMGHSMGGGASFLAAQNNENIDALINFAAAETNPSAESAAVNISIPTLVFSGSDDCVTPSNIHQTPIFDALGSQCKTHITITNGRHCYFAEENISCNLGELFCGEAEINRNQQHEITLRLVKNYLDYVLYESQEPLKILIESLLSNSEISYQSSCGDLNITYNQQIESFEVLPNPTSEMITLTLNEKNLGGTVSIFNLMGNKLIEIKITENSFIVNTSILQNGIYNLFYYNKGRSFTKKILINRSVKEKR